jgi:PPOX class probable F420-dependent enzyme
MTDDFRESFLAGAHVAILGTVDSRGRPHATPVWYLYDDGAFRISIGAGSQKHRNIAANPSVSLVVDQGELPYYAVMVQGEAVIGPQFSDEDSLRLAVRYLGKDMGKAYASRTNAEESISLTVRPRKLLVYDPMPGWRKRARPSPK